MLKKRILIVSTTKKKGRLPKDKIDRGPDKARTHIKRKLPGAIGYWIVCGICGNAYPAGDECPLNHRTGKSLAVKAYALKTGDLRFRLSTGIVLTADEMPVTRRGIDKLKYFQVKGTRMIPRGSSVQALSAIEMAGKKGVGSGGGGSFEPL